MICNQAASFNGCLFKVQQGMQDQLKTIRTESKGKSSTKVGTATDELQHRWTLMLALYNPLQKQSKTSQTGQERLVPNTSEVWC